MYIATLQTKRAELRALQNLNLKNAKDFLPNFVINESSKVEFDKIQSYYSEKCLIDTRQLEFYEIESLLGLFTGDPKYNLMTPVLPLDYAMITPVRKAHYLRIAIPALDSHSYHWIESNISELPDNIIIDFGYLDTPPDQVNLFSTQKLLELLTGRNITILSGSVPRSVHTDAITDYVHPRYEKELFLAIASTVNSKLNYADYCTVHPEMYDTGFGRAVIQIKYTLSDNYCFYRNGLFNEIYDLKSLYSKIANLYSFAPEHCWGDTYIKENSAKDVPEGSPEYWVSVAINHHIHLCLEENL